MKKFEELMQNQEFVKKVIESKTDDEIKAVFKAENHILTDEELAKLKKAGAEAVEAIKKMTDEQIMNAAGGGSYFRSDRSPLQHAVKSTAASALAFGSLAAGITAIVVAAKGKSAKEVALNTLRASAIGAGVGAGLGLASTFAIDYK